MHCRQLLRRCLSTAGRTGTGTGAVSGRVSAAVHQKNNTRGAGASADGGKHANLSAPIELSPPKGTRDFYPDDLAFRTWLFDKWRSVAKAYGYEEYDTSILEHEELYTVKSGDEIGQQLFNFEDKGGRRVTLRPEMTPSLARMVLARRQTLTNQPIKWFSLPQCWRYEKTSRGRRREHYQWNVDVWGVRCVAAEAELLSMLVTSFVSMGLTSSDVGVRFSSRKLTELLLRAVGVVGEARQAEVCVVVDKMDKVSGEAIREMLLACVVTKEGRDGMQLAAAEVAIDGLLEMLQMGDLLELKQHLLQRIEGGATAACPSVAEVESVFSELEQLVDLVENAYGHGHGHGHGHGGSGGREATRGWLQFDPSIVRGLAYYTGVVFEAFDRTGAGLRAVCGGGRYDNLAGTMLGHAGADGSGFALPAVGFGFGDAVIQELLAVKKLLPALPPSKSLASSVEVWAPQLPTSSGDLSADVALFHEVSRLSVRVAMHLRRAGLSGVDTAMVSSGGASAGTAVGGATPAVPPIGKQLKTLMRQASRNGSRVVVLCTVDEYRDAASFVVKCMTSHSQVLVPYSKLEGSGEEFPELVKGLLQGRDMEEAGVA